MLYILPACFAVLIMSLPLCDLCACDSLLPSFSRVFTAACIRNFHSINLGSTACIQQIITVTIIITVIIDAIFIYFVILL